MRNEKRGAVFRQSLRDFPCSVELGKNSPSWGLSRWKGNSGLKFVPRDDEGFSLQGDKRRLVYKGRKRSHRFTILGDNSFEYDCILLREPESNVITLRMEGAENFDFFRQPDFVPDEIFKGSYAVYKKETLVGEGTGKLCHIHRPEIIDARGRRCWGELAVVGSELRITIPEWWLSEAKYPVVVDPTIGTTTVGSQYRASFINQRGTTDSCLIGALAVNRYLLPEVFNGNATAYTYVSSRTYMPQCKPVLYSDNGAAKPAIRRSSNEGNIDTYMSGGMQEEWRSTTFSTNTNIQSGNYVWFGLSAVMFVFMFDYGSTMYYYTYDNYAANLPDNFPFFSDQRYYDYKMSAYFTYSNAQNYVRTLTQGVTLTDIRTLTGYYKRGITQNAKVIETRQVSVGIIRKITQTVKITDFVLKFPMFIRSIFEQIILNEIFTHKRELKRKCADTAVFSSDLKRGQLFLKVLVDSLKAFDESNFTVLFIREIKETSGITDVLKSIREYIKVLQDVAGNIAETIRKGEYFRTERDTVQAGGSALRHLFIFLRILTVSFVRDYIIRRFLVAREELSLKSVITREIVLESKIN